MRRLHFLLVPAFFLCSLFIMVEPQISQAQITFAPGASYATGAGPTSPVLGDLNGDGKLDLVVPNLTGNSLSVFLGNGDGTFTPHPTQPTIAVNQPRGIALGELNGDGKLDLVVANASDNTIAIFLGNGDGTFTLHPPLITFCPPSMCPRVGQVLLGDLNGDGKLDLVVGKTTDSLNNFETFLGNGDGTFSSTLGSVPIPNGGLTPLVDLNGDGKLDLLVVGRGNVTVFLGKGDGTFTPLPNQSLQTLPYGLTLADLNGDGKLDLVYVGTSPALFPIPYLFVQPGNGDGTFGSPIILRALGLAGGPILADLNGDGKLDLILSGNLDGNNFLAVYVGNGDGTFGTETDYATGGPVQIALGDLNGDGKPDLVIANSAANTVSVLLNTSPSEIFVRNLVTGDLAVWYMGGATRVGYDYIDYGMDLNVAVVGVGDFNGDGKSDILVWHQVTGDLAVLYMNRATLIGYDYINRGTDLNWRIVGVGDFNGDGHPDILVWNQVTGDLAVLYMNGPTRIGYGYINRGTDLNCRIVGVGDFNGDGKPDILVWNQVTGDLAVLYMNGSTITGYDYINRGTDLNWRVVGTNH